MAKSQLPIRTGAGVKFRLIDGSFEGDMVSLAQPNPTVEVYDVTGLETSNGLEQAFAEKIASMIIEGGTIPVEVYYKPDQRVPLGGDPKGFTVAFPGTTEGIVGQGFFTSSGGNPIEKGSVMMLSCVLQITGQLDGVIA